MKVALGVVAGASRIASVCLLAGGLGGCYSMGGAGSGGSTTKPPVTPAPTPAKFSAVFGQFAGKVVVGSGSTSTLSRDTTMVVGSSALNTFEVNTYTSPENPSVRKATVVAAGAGYFNADNVTFESNGSAVRGTAVGSQHAWAVLSTSPGNRLDASLGTTSLEHSYAGTGWKNESSRSSIPGDNNFSSMGIYGGSSTSDMPSSGKADYAGGFEGLENSATGATLRTSNISGKANLSADFAAKTVRGRIDNVNNHSVGPMQQAAGYSIGYNGTITGSNFSGTSWLTQANSDAPLSGYNQNSGTLQGGFFGPGAVETAGAMSVSAADSSKKLLVTGAFGAKKK